MALLDVFKGNARLERNLNKAKEQEATGDYNGPDGKIVGVFVRTATGIKEGDEGVKIPWAAIELVVANVEGQEEFAGQKLPLKFFRFVDGDYATAEEVQGEYMEALANCGIDTTVDDDEFDGEVQKAKGALINCAVVSKAGKGKNAGKTFKNIFLNGVSSAVEIDENSDDEGQKDSSDEQPQDEAPFETNDSVEAEEGDDGSSTESSDDGGEEEAGDEVKASEWIGFEVQYKKGPRSKPRTYTVKDADDDADTVTLTGQDGDELKDIAFSKLIFPED